VAPDFDWHHIVEQGGGNEARFGPQAIHNTDNLIPVERSAHRQISAYYGRKVEGISPREWLKTQSFDVNKSFGVDVLRKFGVIP
jgi:hypothetical protein